MLTRISCRVRLTAQAPTLMGGGGTGNTEVRERTYFFRRSSKFFKNLILKL